MDTSYNLIAERDEKIEKELLIIEDQYNFTEKIESLTNDLLITIENYINDNRIEIAQYLSIDSVQEYLIDDVKLEL